MKTLLIIVFITPLTVFSQNSSLGNWLIYFGDKKINEKFNWHHEVQYRNYNFIGDIDQLLLRTGIGYNLSENNNNILLGYGFIYNEPYILNSSEKSNFIEHRLYQQFITRQAFSRFYLQHRYRFEQRFFESEFKLRFRYFLALNIPLNNREMSENSFYFSAYNEFFLQTEDNYFDRNRLYAGLGFKFSKNIRAELGFMNQTTNDVSRNQLNVITFINL